MTTDLRLALRSLKKNRGFSVVVVLTLALGIGANTAIFSLVDALMLRQLAVKDPGELWRVFDDGPSPDGASAGTEVADIYSWPLAQRFAQALPAGSSLAAMTPTTRFTARLGADATTTAVTGQLVSGSYFTTFGAQPALGRLFTADDTASTNDNPVAVLGYGFWQRQFGGDPRIVGRAIVLNRVPITVVGIAENGFTGNWVDTTIQVWLPLVMQHSVGYRQNAATHNAEDEQAWPTQNRVDWLNVAIRSSDEQRQAIVERLAPMYLADRREVMGDQPDAEGRSLLQRQLALESFARGYSVMRDQYSRVLTLLMAMVTLLLLVACANVANLLLARWTARQREVAVRLAVGAARGRLIWQLLTESLVLAVLGGLVAIVLADWISSTIATSVSVRSLLPVRVGLDGRVLAFCGLVSIVTSLAFGIAPAIRGTAASPSAALKSGVAPSSRRAMLGMRPLVAAQVALSVVLVVAAGLFGRSLVKLSTLDPGYDRSSQRVQLRIDPLGGGMRLEEAPDLYRRVVARARQVPGVGDAEIAYLGVASGTRSIGSIDLEGYVPGPDERVRFLMNNVGPTYFDTTGMELVAGRAFTEHDIEGQPNVAVINEAAARYFGGPTQALSKRLGYGELDKEIVGVVRDARVLSLREPPAAMVFYPIFQMLRPAQAVEIRATGDAMAVGETVRRALSEMDARLLAVNRPTLVDDALARGLTRDRLIAYLAAGFGATALFLACIGLYGVLTYSVQRRTAEMGVRMAVGARPLDVAGLVLREGLTVAIVGIVIGVAAALTASRTIETLLFEVTATDVATYLAVAAMLLGTAALATYLPARRASRVDPMTALRSE
jgi:predicted permease